MWGTVHGNMPRLHGGGLLVLYETQDVSVARYVNGKQTSLGTGSTGPD